jgi:hypothetical protein
MDNYNYPKLMAPYPTLHPKLMERTYIYICGIIVIIIYLFIFFYLLLLLLLLLILFMFIICMCSLIFQTNRLSTEHPMFAPSDRGVGWSRGGRALRYVGSRMAYSNPRKDRNVYQGCFKLCMHNICVPYLYYIMYLYNFF